MAHLTAGDLAPIGAGYEVTYGTPIPVPTYYADVKGDGGSITIQDTPTPYLAWRSGSRSFDSKDYVTQQNIAEYSDVLEVRDAPNWANILVNACGANNGTHDLPGSLPSRTTVFGVNGLARHMPSGLMYAGCKTNELTIKGDAPGAVVSFEERVMASYSQVIEMDDYTFTSPSTHAVQWVGGVTMEGGETTVYPQSFQISIKNNLERELAYDLSKGGSYTKALPEGRREIEMEMEVWRQDLQDIIQSRGIGTWSDITLTLGTANPYRIALTDVVSMADGQISPLIQDKQRATLRFRATGITITAVTQQSS